MRKILNILRRGILISPGGRENPHGSTYIRILLRLREDELSGIECPHLSPEEALERISKKTDFVLVQRHSLTHSQAESLIRACRENDIDLILEMDDDLLAEGVVDPDRQSAIRIVLENANIVLTSTHHLRAKLLQFNRDVRVIENKLSAYCWRVPISSDVPIFHLPNDGARILYMGTMSHKRDLDLVVPAVAKLNAEGLRCTIYTIGIGENLENEFVKSIDIPKECRPYPRFVNWLRANAKNFDVAIAPLEEAEFNQCKSPLKYFDYAGCGLPGIFSDVVPYRGVVEHDVSGFLTANHADAWKNALRTMLSDSAVRNKIAKNAAEDTYSRHLMSDNIYQFAEALGALKIERLGEAKESYGNRKLESSPYFDSFWYVSQYNPLNFYTGIIRSGIRTDFDFNASDACDHYLERGARRGYDPSPLFSTKGYLDRYRDVARSGANPLLHFINHGKKEGRQPKPRPRAISPELRPDARGPISHVLPIGNEWSHSEKSICAHLHLFHPEMAAEFGIHLASIKQPFTLLISTRLGLGASIKRSIKDFVPNATITVREVENRGRDVSPWVVEFREEIRKHDIFCHVHSKATAHTEGHVGWREHLLHETLGSTRTVSEIVSLLSSPEIGLVFPAYYEHVSDQPKWGANKDTCDRLFCLMGGRRAPDACPDFPAGSFFWCRTEILKPLFDLGLTLNDFENEEAQTDGTLAHAVERLMGLLPALSSLKSACTVAQLSSAELKQYCAA